VPKVSHRPICRAAAALAFWGLLFILPAFAPASAAGDAGIAEASLAYAAGDYDVAAVLTHGNPHPVAQVLYARALLTKAMLLNGADTADPAVDVLARDARRSADAARQADPGLVEAYVLGAISRGLIADRSLVPIAVRKVWEARSLIDAALDLSPRDPRVLATDAGWHLTLTGRLGSAIAGLLFSASRDHGLAAFARVFALVGDDPSMLYHFAKVRILQSDPPALGEARAALHTLLRIQPVDALGQAVQLLGAPLLAAVEAKAAERRTQQP